MKLLVQWATAHARDWTEIDSADWAGLPKKSVPVGGELIDDVPGWLFDVCVQGMCSGTGDHVAVEHLGDSVRLTVWKDDVEDYTPDELFARVLTFHPLKPDAKLGGAINTDIESVIYAGPKLLAQIRKQKLVDT